MQQTKFSDLGFGVTCIDADYVQEGLACYYLLQHEDEVALIETGTSHCLPGLLALLEQRGIAKQQVRYIIPTHVHLDHAGGASAMMAAFEQAQLLIHPRGARHMADPEKLVASAMQVYGEEAFRAMYGDIEPVPVSRIREMADGEVVELAGRRLEMRHTRGHASHHMCIWDEYSKSWFSGDMFGVSYPWFRFENADFVMPSTTPTQFDPETYLESLQLLDSYNPERMFLTHYGALSYTREKSALLAKQVEFYRDLGRKLLNEPEKLQDELIDYSLELLEQYDKAGSTEEHRKWLAFDIPLNVQGLQVWQGKLTNS